MGWKRFAGVFSSAVCLFPMLVSGFGAAGGTGEAPHRDGAASGSVPDCDNAQERARAGDPSDD